MSIDTGRNYQNQDCQSQEAAQYDNQEDFELDDDEIDYQGSALDQICNSQSPLAKIVNEPSALDLLQDECGDIGTDETPGQQIPQRVVESPKGGSEPCGEAPKWSDGPPSGDWPRRGEGPDWQRGSGGPNKGDSPRGGDVPHNGDGAQKAESQRTDEAAQKVGDSYKCGMPTKDEAPPKRESPPKGDAGHDPKPPELAPVPQPAPIDSAPPMGPELIGDAKPDPRVQGVLNSFVDRSSGKTDLDREIGSLTTEQKTELKQYSDALQRSSISWARFASDVDGTTEGRGEADPRILLNETLKDRPPTFLGQTLSQQAILANGGSDQEALQKREDIAGQIGYKEMGPPAGTVPAPQPNGGGEARNHPMVQEVLGKIDQQPEIKWLSDALNKTEINWAAQGQLNHASHMETGLPKIGFIKNDFDNVKNDVDKRYSANIVIHEGMHAAGYPHPSPYATSGVLADKIGYKGDKDK